MPIDSQATADRMGPPSKLLLALESRALLELAALGPALPWLRTAPRGDGHPVLVLPGLAASDVSTRPLRCYLTDRGYAPHGWGLGRNRGLRPGVYAQMLEGLRHLRTQYGRKVSLIGWSLGGVYARELAKQAPDDVRLVITLGSPFAGNPKASNVWRVYEYASGEKVGARRRNNALEEPPPVPTTCIYTRSDGIVAWQCTVERPSPRAENIEVHASHCGLGHHPAVLYAIADRLSQPEGTWAPFNNARGLNRLIYPEPTKDVS
jgi:pimeloyl-ACP methyl ester carboxylesterase